jgi:hypothetical protein
MAIEIRLWEKVVGYFNELLLDERRTLEDLNKNSLSFKIDLSVQSKDSRHSGDRDNRNRWNKKVDARLKMKNKNYGFEMIYIILIASIIVLPLSVFQVVEYFNSLKNSQQIVQNLQLFTTTTDFWNTNLMMRFSLLSTLIWNDQRFINSTTTKSSDVYKHTLKRLSDSLIPEMVGYKDSDLGTNYGTAYKKLLTEVNGCKVSEEQGRPIPNCGVGDLDFMGKPIIDYLKWTMTLTKDAFYIWELQMSSKTALTEVFSNRQFAAYINNTLKGGIERQFYYAILIALGNNLKVVIDSSITVGSGQGSFVISGNQTKPSEYYLFLVIPLSLLTLLLLLRFVYWKMVWTYTAFWRTALLLPVELILKNPLLTKYLRGIEASTKSRISFF